MLWESANALPLYMVTWVGYQSGGGRKGPPGSHPHFMYGETEVSVGCPKIRRITGIMDVISLNNLYI